MAVSDRVAHVAHLVRRFFGSLSSRPPAANDERWARAWLAPGEVLLWDLLPASDRRHAIDVAHRFVERAPGAGRPALAGALLHDVG
jgi:hypothetical protein